MRKYANTNKQICWERFVDVEEKLRILGGSVTEDSGDRDRS